MTDQEILDAKAQVGAGGLGCEPASAASVAGAKLLRRRRRHRARASASSASSPATSSRTRRRPSPTTRTDQDRVQPRARQPRRAPRRLRQPRRRRSTTTSTKSSRRFSSTVSVRLVLPFDLASSRFAGRQRICRPMKIAIHGAAGRMGQRRHRRRQPEPALQGRRRPRVGQPSGTWARTPGLIAGVGQLGVPLGVVGESDADVVIDFSVPGCRRRRHQALPRIQEAAGDRHHRPRRRASTQFIRDGRASRSRSSGPPA